MNGGCCRARAGAGVGKSVGGIQLLLDMAVSCAET